MFLTAKKIEGIVETNTTFNQIKYAHFLKILILKLKDDPEIESKRLVIVADIFFLPKIHFGDELRIVSGDRYTIFVVKGHQNETKVGMYWFFL